MDKALPKKEKNFNKWYASVINQAELAERSPVKGAMTILPYGYAIWELIQKDLDTRIKSLGVRNAYFPIFIPESFLKKEKEHIEGFSPELAVVTYAGGKKLAEPYVVRPTSETIIYEAYSRWIQSYRDLPLLINQWANVVRWELRPRLFLRTTEFLWQEGHTAHATLKEADEFARRILLEVYEKFLKETLNLPVLAGYKSELQKFAGAEITYTVETITKEAKALQMGTSHNLSDHFAKVFNITYLNKEGKRGYVYQTSWGVSTRLIGGLIMTHGDDFGLVLPPALAPVQVVLLPLTQSELNYAHSLKKALADFRVLIDSDLDERLGERLYKWEKKGVPIRIEIGQRELTSKELLLFRRDLLKKEKVLEKELSCKINQTLGEMSENLYKKAQRELESLILPVREWQEFREAIENNKAVYAHFCGKKDCEQRIQEETKATPRCLPFRLGEKVEGAFSVKECIYCKEKVSSLPWIFAQAY